MIIINKLVQSALQSKQAVVALESTIITHGMDYPINLETALAVEQVIKDQGAVPATIAIIDGIIRIGLTNEEIEFVAKNKNLFGKCSRRDLSVILAKKGNGSTTVAATMMCAHMAGIKVFVTGGIGGVHRGAESTFDISADLQELGQTPVAVISAGAKSILDIPKTLEYLETQGVPTLGYKTHAFPNFFTSDSGCKCSHKVQDEREAAAIIHTQFNKLKLKNGILVGVPIPPEMEADGQLIEKAIQQALSECKVIGNEITPFLLKRVVELTEGKSAQANVALIKNNAKVGALIARELCKVDE